MDKWRTTISTHRNGELYVRGKKLTDLIRSRTFVEIIFLLWRGKLPRKNEAAMFNAMLVASSEHGLEASSTFVARTVTSTGNSFSSAIAGGILTMGEWHGGAIERAAYILQLRESPEKIVRDAAKNRSRVSGFGHRLYKERDPRAQALFDRARTLGFYGKFVKKALRLESLLKLRTKKVLPINIDGALAALFLELGFDWRLARGFFILARIAGITAHCFEEMVNEKPYRRLSEEDVEYIGPTIKNDPTTAKNIRKKFARRS